MSETRFVDGFCYIATQLLIVTDPIEIVIFASYRWNWCVCLHFKVCSKIFKLFLHFSFVHLHLFKVAKAARRRWREKKKNGEAKIRQNKKSKWTPRNKAQFNRGNQINKKKTIIFSLISLLLPHRVKEKVNTRYKTNKVKTVHANEFRPVSRSPKWYCNVDIFPFDIKCIHSNLDITIFSYRRLFVKKVIKILYKHTKKQKPYCAISPNTRIAGILFYIFQIFVTILLFHFLCLFRHLFCCNVYVCALFCANSHRRWQSNEIKYFHLISIVCLLFV